jgi:hypothetical protein
MKVTKAIVSLVVFASLGGFGAIDVVQSFQPVRSVALTSIVGCGRVVNDANTAHLSPKFVVPRSVYCYGGKVPCSAAMVCAAATAARCNKLGANVAFRSACARFPTFLSASSSLEDDPKPLDSVWVQLYVDGEKAGKPALVKLEPGAIVFNLATAVKELLGDDLVGIAPNRLDVYKSDADPFALMLDPGEIITDAFGGTNSKSPIRVTARTPNQGMLFRVKCVLPLQISHNSVIICQHLSRSS